MLKLLFVLVPTVILFGCRTSVPSVAGFASVTDRVAESTEPVTHSTERPTYEDPFGQIQPQAQQPQQMAEPYGMVQQQPAQQPSIQKAVFTPPPESNAPAPLATPAEVNPFMELPATQPKSESTDKSQSPAGKESLDTSWYSQHEEGATAVRDLSNAVPAGDDSPGWKRSRKAISAN